MKHRVRPLIFAAVFSSASFTASAQNKQAAIPWDAMDLGPFHSATFKIPQRGNQITAKGIAIKVGSKDSSATVLFDTELLRVSAAWTGGFIDFPRGRGGLEGQTTPAGQLAFSTDYAPGWTIGPMVADSRNLHQGHLPNTVAKYRGLFVNGAEVVLSYTVGKAVVLDLPGTDFRGGKRVFTRTISAGPLDEASTMLLADVPDGKGTVDADGVAILDGPESTTAVTVIGLPKTAKLAVVENGRVTLQLPALKDAKFQIVIWNGAKADLPKSADLLKPSREMPEPLTAALPGPSLWGDALETQGKLGTGDDAYVLDEITLPDPNPYNSWLRLGGHDFFPNGNAAVVNVSGDVWIVSGLDATLGHIKWKRFATGLFQPLGCKVVDGNVYVLGRDQITRLHDLDRNGEADFYECFNNDCVVTENYHEFALDLQTDSAGRFYYGKGSPWTPTNMSPHQGTMLRVTQDGTTLEKICDGLRAPNGLGMGPNDVLTCSDNQGHWMPANRINIIKQGGFYGMTPAAHRVLHFTAADGTAFDANPSSAEDRAKYKTDFYETKSPIPTTGYDLPLLWMPQNVDNSPGGEVWVSGGKWGPWEGRMLHLSYGHCRLYGVAMETVDGVAQGAVIKFPFKFPSGVMRGRFSPQDGQLYATGLNVWQSDASKFGCFTRVRYTGKSEAMVNELHVLKDGVQLKFTAPVEEKSATDSQNFSVERWNYQWTGSYGSHNYSVTDPTKHGGNLTDIVPIQKITLSPDKQTLTLTLTDMSPVMQMKIRFKIQSADGKPVDQEIHNTIHRVPGMKVGGL